MKEIYVFWLSPLFYLLPIAHLSRSWPRGIQRQTHLHSRSPKKSRFKIHHTSDDGSSHKPWHTALPCINWRYRLKVSASVLVSAIPCIYLILIDTKMCSMAQHYELYDDKRWEKNRMWNQNLQSKTGSNRLGYFGKCSFFLAFWIFIYT